LAVRVGFVFRPSRLALFVDGCFWHGCPKYATQPKNNRVFWRRRFARNRERDELVNRTLRKSGRRGLRIWECDLTRRPETCVRRIQRALRR
jgi:DNA mismatch endonuclease (patch repair protein)